MRRAVKGHRVDADGKLVLKLECGHSIARPKGYPLFEHAQCKECDDEVEAKAKGTGGKDPKRLAFDQARHAVEDLSLGRLGSVRDRLGEIQRLLK